MEGRVARVLGFFAAKRLLLAPDVLPRPSVKLHIDDVLYVAEHVEPRVYEVLPAALIRFPSSLLHKERLPNEIADVVQAIKRGDEKHQGFEGFRYWDMKRWAERTLPDRRSKSPRERRKMVSLKLKPVTATRLKELSIRKRTSQAKLIDELVQQAHSSLASQGA